MSANKPQAPAPQSPDLLGVEIGGTKLQLLVMNESGEICARVRLQADVQKGAAGIQDQIAEEVRKLRQGCNFRAVGVGFGGPVDWQTGRVAVSHQVQGWSGFELGKWISELAGAPARIDNDANVAALGEAVQGAGRGYGKVFYVTLGSGVGGGFVANGAIFHGAHPGECEIGHLRLDRSGVTVESRCSGWAVDSRIRELPEHERAGELWRLSCGMQRAQARALFPALESGDPAARRILDETCAELAFALSHVTHLLHPEIIILGGGLSEVGEPLKLGIAGRLPVYVMSVFQPGPELALAALREDAVPIGALELARQVGSELSYEELD